MIHLALHATLFAKFCLTLFIALPVIALCNMEKIMALNINL